MDISQHSSRISLNNRCENGMRITLLKANGQAVGGGDSRLLSAQRVACEASNYFRRFKRISRPWSSRLLPTGAAQVTLEE
jgi:hypothetical protein